MKKSQNEKMEYRQWRDENGTFNSEMNVYFSQCDGKGDLTLSELFRITSDIAVEDYRQRGLPRDFLTANNFAILVARSSFRIHRMPKENERATVATLEEKPEPMLLTRSYEITSAQGEPLVSGMSGWMIIDPAARRIIPTKRFTLREPNSLRLDHDCLPPSKIQVPENLEKIGERKILRSDTDANGHTNNSRYSAFITDSLPENSRGKKISDIMMNFSKEAMLGETVEIFASPEADGKIIVVGKTERGVSFESVIIFRA